MTALEFLVNITIDTIGVDQAELRKLRQQEARSAKELAASGALRRLWRVEGSWANVGLWQAEDEQSLWKMFEGLPLRPYMDIKVSRLGLHPNDPVALSGDPSAGTPKRVWQLPDLPPLRFIERTGESEHCGSIETGFLGRQRPSFDLPPLPPLRRIQDAADNVREPAEELPVASSPRRHERAKEAPTSACVELDLSRVQLEGSDHADILARLMPAATESIRDWVATLAGIPTPIDVIVRPDQIQTALLAEANRRETKPVGTSIEVAARDEARTKDAAITVLITHSGSKGLLRCTPPLTDGVDLALDLGKVSRRVVVQENRDGDDVWVAKSTAELTVNSTYPSGIEAPIWVLINAIKEKFESRLPPLIPVNTRIEDQS